MKHALLKDKSLGLENKKSQYEKRKEKRERNFTKQVNKCFVEKAAISLLSEGESKRKYHQKRSVQSFTTPENDQPQPKSPKNTHQTSTMLTGTKKMLKLPYVTGLMTYLLIGVQ